MPVILVWTLRMWHLTVHGRMDEDPVVFALKDRLSLVLALTCCAILFLAWVMTVSLWRDDYGSWGRVLGGAP
jgi:hypothetical protein